MEGISESNDKGPKKRSIYSAHEEERLILLVGQQKDVLESKEKDFGTINKKAKAWDALTVLFNSDEMVSKKTTDQLRKKWENLKGRAKKEVVMSRNYSR
jgi:Myb/SANT-like DNA-binding domain